MVKKLLTTLLSSSMLLSGSSLLVLANEQEIEEMEFIFEEISDKDPQKSTISEDVEIYHSGKVGTADWTIDSTGTLTIGEGEFDYKGKQLSSSASSFTESDWPWSNFRIDIEYINGIAPFKTESYSMFAFTKLYNLKSADLSGWDTSKSISFSHMFEGCSKLESIDLSSWDTSVLRETSSMFNNCRDLKVINISGWNITKFWGASDMFTGCSNLYKMVYSGSPEIGQIISKLPSDYRWYQNGQGPYAVSEIPSLPQGATATLIREDHKDADITPAVSAPAMNQKGEMYRLYNPNSGEHFYTGDTNEKNQLSSMGWKYEGIGWYAPSSSATPVYRLYNKNSSDHHYTIDINEKNTLVRAGWKDEGIGWYSDDAKTVPLYRVYNPNSAKSSHHYTTDQSERNSLVSRGWKDEGVAWYALKEGQLLPSDPEPIPSPTPAPVDYSAAYRPILDEAKRIVNEQGRGTNYRDDLFGIVDAPGSSLNDIGYTIQDLTGDGIPELVIGFPGYDYIIALYTLVDNKPINTFFGWSRSNYCYAGGSQFIYHGSGSAYSGTTGLLSLSKDGQSQVYSVCYYTEPNSSRTGVNTYLISNPITVTGSSSGPTLPGGTTPKGKYIGGSEVASQKNEELYSKKQSLNLTPLSQWK